MGPTAVAPYDFTHDKTMIDFLPGQASATFTVPIADQAQLHGILARVRDLGVPLLGLRVCRETEGHSGAPDVADGR